MKKDKKEDETADGGFQLDISTFLDEAKDCCSSLQLVNQVLDETIL